MSRGGKVPAVDPAAFDDVGDAAGSMMVGESAQSLGAVTEQVAALLREGSPKADEAGRAPAQSPDSTDDDLAAALAAALGEGGRSGEGEGEGASGDAGGALSLNSLAEKLGVDVAELYKLEVGMPDGDVPVTLEQLKDEATAYRRSEAERIEWEGKVTAERNRLANMTAELQALVGMIPEQMRTPEMVKQAQTRLEAAKQLESARLLQRVPEWRDAKQYAADMEVIGPHVAEWGFDAEELGQVYDHRLLAYIRHNALREQRLRAALENMKHRKQGRGNGPKSGGREPAHQRAQAPLSRNERGARINEIAKLLGGKK